MYIYRYEAISLKNVSVIFLLNTFNDSIKFYSVCCQLNNIKYSLQGGNFSFMFYAKVMFFSISFEHYKHCFSCNSVSVTSLLYGINFK